MREMPEERLLLIAAVLLMWVLPPTPRTVIYQEGLSVPAGGPQVRVSDREFLLIMAILASPDRDVRSEAAGLLEKEALWRRVWAVWNIARGEGS